MWYCNCALVQYMVSFAHALFCNPVARSPPREGMKYVNLRKYHEQLVKDIRSCTFPAKHPSFLFEKCEINGNRYETNRTSLVAFKKWKKTKKQTTKNKQTNNICLIKYALLSNARLLTVSANVETDQEKVDFSLHS